MTQKAKPSAKRFLKATNPAVKRQLGGAKLLADFLRRPSKGLTLRAAATC